MKKTIIAHYFNEEFLLPFWLNWHKQFFDFGILIDYHSNDQSNNIIHQICPSWKIIKPKYNNGFHARDLDREVVDAEKSCEGWKLCLNVTEFVFHDNFSNYLDSQPEKVMGIWLPVISMVDKAENRDKVLDERPLVLQRTTGQFGCGSVRNTSFGRLIHKAEHGHYNGWGRHASDLPNIISPGDAYHLWFGFSPWNERFIKRKAQIRDKIIDDDMKTITAGTHMMTRDQLESTFMGHQGSANDLLANTTYKKIYDRIQEKYKNNLPN